ncbi:MAG: CoA transferase [Alphaproteobacteria bacterium]|nr:CoA transferase [Alphaproteobacteria bacterium]
MTSVSNDRPRGPLSGIVVLDLSRILAGPFCTLLLAELGARVIKVEDPRTGDDARAYGPFIEGESVYFAAVNRGKESVALDLKKPEDRAIFEQLLAKADVLIENFRPGTMDKLGYGWEALHSKYPRLVYCAASGFGHTGPYKTAPAYDMVVQGLGGIMSVTGHPGAPVARIGVSVGDLGAGLYAAIGVQSALFHRERTGEATFVDIGMLDCQLSLMENPAARYLNTGSVPGPMGGRHASITPFGIFPTGDRQIIIAAGNDSLFKKLCAVLAAPAMAEDKRYLTNGSRTENVLALEAEIGAILKTDTAAAWLAKLDAAGIPAGPINDVKGALEHPQTAARHMVVETATPGGRKVKVIGNPIKISGFPDLPTRPAAPALGQHRDAIVAELSKETK